MLSTSSPVAPSTDFNFTVDIMNTGNAASLDTSKYQIYRSADMTIDSTDDTEGNETAISPAIAADDKKSVSETLTSPTTAGIYYYGICIVDGPCSAGTKLSVAAYLIHIHNAALAEPQSGSANMEVWVSIHPDSPVNAVPTGETIVLSISTGPPATGTPATAGTDFTAPPTNATVTIGESSDTVRTRKNFMIPILADGVAETTAETFGITISTANTKALIVNDTATASIGGEKQSFLHWTPSHPQIIGQTVTLVGQVAVPDIANNNFRTQLAEFILGTNPDPISDTAVNTLTSQRGGLDRTRLTAAANGGSTDKKLVFGTLSFNTYVAADTGARLGLSGIYFLSDNTGDTNVARATSLDTGNGSSGTLKYGQAYKNATFLEQTKAVTLTAPVANDDDVAMVYDGTETGLSYRISFISKGDGVAEPSVFKINSSTGLIQVADKTNLVAANSPFTITVTATKTQGTSVINTDTQTVTVTVTVN